MSFECQAGDKKLGVGMGGGVTLSFKTSKCFGNYWKLDFLRGFNAVSRNRL